MPPPRPTHFLCLPLVTPASLPQLTASLASFRRDPAIQLNPVGGSSGRQRPPPRNVKPPDSDGNGYGTATESTMPLREGYVPVAAVRPIGTLHLTLGVMRLESDERIKAASEFLQALDIDAELRQSRMHDAGASSLTSISTAQTTSTTQKQTQHDPLIVQLKGLHAMQQAQKTRVLYAEPVDSSARLLPFCQQLHSKFIQAGFLIDEGRDLKLHATIVNTIYAAKQGSSSKSKKTVECNASELIERWKDSIWAEITINKVAICEMGAKEDDNGEVRYVEIAEKAFR